MTPVFTQSLSPLGQNCSSQRLFSQYFFPLDSRPDATLSLRPLVGKFLVRLRGPDPTHRRVRLPRLSRTGRATTGRSHNSPLQVLGHHSGEHRGDSSPSAVQWDDEQREQVNQVTTAPLQRRGQPVWCDRQRLWGGWVSAKAFLGRWHSPWSQKDEMEPALPRAGNRRFPA